MAFLCNTVYVFIFFKMSQRSCVICVIVTQEGCNWFLCGPRVASFSPLFFVFYFIFMYFRWFMLFLTSSCLLWADRLRSRYFLQRAWLDDQPSSSSDYRWQLGRRGPQTGWMSFGLMWRCKRGKVDPLALGATGGSLLAVERVCLWAQRYVYLPLRLLNSRTLPGAVTGPLGSIFEREADILLSLNTPHTPLFPNSVATNYSFSCFLLLVNK